MGIGTALILAGAGIGGSLISKKASQDEARTQRRFQMSMSQSAHQREVEDLRAAGLNPILSAGGTGASTPSGAMPTIPDIGSSVTGGINAATALRKMKADVKNTEAIAGQNIVEAKIASDMLKTYNSNSAVKATVIGGMLGKKAGVPLGVGAGVGAATSAIGKIKENKTFMDTLFGTPIKEGLENKGIIPKTKSKYRNPFQTVGVIRQ